MGLEKISDFRKEKGLTIEELSEKSGVPVSTIKKISAGITTNPNLDTVKALAKALNCKLDDFDNEPDTKKSPTPEKSEVGDRWFSYSDIEQVPEGEIKLIGLFYDFLVDAGYVQSGQPLTDREMDHAAAILNMIQFVYGRSVENDERARDADAM